MTSENHFVWLERYIDEMIEPFGIDEKRLNYLNQHALQRMRKLDTNLRFCKAHDLRYKYEEIETVSKTQDLLGRAAKVYLENKVRPRRTTRYFLDRLIKEAGLEETSESLGENSVVDGVNEFHLDSNGIRELADMVSTQEISPSAEVLLTMGDNVEVLCRLSDLQCTFKW